MPMPDNSASDTEHALPHTAARALYNLPSPSEKLTDGTLPITWPSPYLDQLKADDVASLPEAAPLSQQESSSLSRLPEDYAQLMRKLQAESLAARQGSQVDKALCAAHYVSTLIAALAFVAMMGIVTLTCFPSLLSA